MEISLSPDKRYSYADYLTWADQVRREILNGIVKLMSPAPARMHQKVSMRILKPFINFLDHKKCEVYHAPFDVRLPKMGSTENTAIYTVVQPDICVVCDQSKLDNRGCLGAPDLIVEIVSQGSAIRDIKEKFEIYQEAGVLEYWIVRPEDPSVEVFLLSQAGKYEHKGIHTVGDLVPVSIFNGELLVDLAEVFRE